MNDDLIYRKWYSGRLVSKGRIALRTIVLGANTGNCNCMTRYFSFLVFDNILNMTELLCYLTILTAELVMSQLPPLENQCLAKCCFVCTEHFQ